MEDESRATPLKAQDNTVIWMKCCGVGSSTGRMPKDLMTPNFTNLAEAGAGHCTSLQSHSQASCIGLCEPLSYFRASGLMRSWRDERFC